MSEANSGKGIKAAVAVLGVLVLGGVIYAVVGMRHPGTDTGGSEQAASNNSGTSSTSAANPGSETQSGQGTGAEAGGITPFEPKTFDPVTELKIQDLKPGNGAEATAGKMVTVHYTGWLSNGQKFDSSKDRGEPFQFPLGGGRVIKGWDQGVAGMKVGGIRRLTIPPQLAYGERGAPGAIPMNASLQFDVELLNVE